ncbi:MAG: Gfo/Idh/MocA family oxidoreductase [Chloroflexi bacterium]|nr:Gfo/Idh/MocA family oxidoreductase [Chloroflexota bacterium]
MAVVGAGLMAREHLRAFGDVPGVALVGVHSRTRARAEALAAEFEVPVVTGSVEELYEKSAADVVVVAVSELSAAAVSGECFAFPWTVLLEKPPGYNLRVAEEIRAAASAAGRRVLVGLNRRFYSSTRAVLDGLGAQDGTRFVLAQDQQDPQAALAAGKPEEVVEKLSLDRAHPCEG